MGESSKSLHPLFCFDVGHSPEIVCQVGYARVGRMITELLRKKPERLLVRR